MYPEVSRRWFLAGVAGLQLSLHAPCWADDLGDQGDQASKKETKSDDVYEPGDGVTAPKLLHYVEPEFSPKSKEAYVEGVVRISTVVDADGSPIAYRVTSGLNAEEDRTAVEAYKKWKFKPCTKNGQPVNVRLSVEVEFHLL